MRDKPKKKVKGYTTKERKYPMVIIDGEKSNQEKLTKTERVKLFVTLSGYLFPKNKPIEEKIEPRIPFKLSDLVTFESD